MTTNRSYRWTWAGVAALVTLSAITACGTNEQQARESDELRGDEASGSPEQADSSTSIPTLEASPETMASLLHRDVDYNVYKSPQEGAAESDLVVRGSLDRVEPGRRYVDSEVPDHSIEHIVFTLKVTEVVGGRDGESVAAAQESKEVQFEVSIGPGLSAEAVSAALPDTTDVLLFLAFGDAPPASMVLETAGAVKDEAKVLMPYTQGFIIASADGKVLSVLQGDEVESGPWAMSIDEMTAILNAAASAE